MFNGFVCIPLSTIMDHGSYNKTRVIEVYVLDILEDGAEQARPYPYRP